MIQAFVDKFMAAKELVLVDLQKNPPRDYEDLFYRMVRVIGTDDEDGYGPPCTERIQKIDDGDYQGTLLFIVGAAGYQPSTYWAVCVSYGSCSGCDTFEDIRSYEDGCSIEQAEQYWTLMLHMVQGLKEIS